MTQRKFVLSALSVAAVAMLAVAPADAQPVEAGVSAPPIALILFDTSGSMEWRDDGPDNFYPNCIDDGQPTADAEGASRMHAAIEVLTGTVINRYCAIDLRDSHPDRIDQVDPSRDQLIRHSRLCAQQADPLLANHAVDCVPADPSAPFAGIPQAADGLIDVFGDQIAFGFMAFDSFPEEGTCADGMFSYGPSRSMPSGASLEIPNPPPSPSSSMSCSTNPTGFCWNLGARAPYVDEPGAPNCSDGSVVQGWTVPPLDPSGALSQAQINAQVQEQILRALPYWSTPIGAMLEDAYIFYTQPPEYFAYKGEADGRDYAYGLEDPYGTCRRKYAVMITDGIPSFSDCVRTGDTTSTDVWGEGCESYPYADAEYYARQLFEAGIPLYVIGFNIPETTGSVLHEIAAAGGTTEARFAGSGLSLVFELGDILSQIASGTPSRTTPANASRLSASPDGVGEFTFLSNFSIHEGSPYWTGEISRVSRFCSSGVLQPPVSASFSEWLDGRTLTQLDDMKILTASPHLHSCVLSQSGSSDESLFTSFSPNPLTGSYGVTGAEVAEACQVGAPPGASAAVSPACLDLADGTVGFDTVLPPGSLAARCLVEFDPTVAANHPAVFGAADSDIARMFARWLRGYSLTQLHSDSSHQAQIDEVIPTAQFRWDGTRYRNDRVSRFGPVIHSSPTVVTVPDARIELSAGYTAFVEETAERPTVLYVATTDGLLRAHDAFTREELFTFLPSSVQHRIGDTMSSHRVLIDGAPVVQDVRTFRDSGGVERWMTALLLPYRGGGRGVTALDVTDPTEPSFLWELDGELDPQLGYTYSAPDIGTVYLAQCIDGVDACERAVAIIGGGAPPSGLTDWETSNIGRTLYVVDLETGRVIRRFTHMRDRLGDLVPIPAPVTGDIAAFDTFVGTLMTRAFVGLLNGQVLRLDFTSSDPANWGVDLFFDPEEDLELDPDDDIRVGGVFFRPTIALSAQSGRAVVVFGTGNLDDLDRVIGEQNYVVSMTEKPIFDTDGIFLRMGGELNWAVELGTNERMTARPRIFNRRAYFATFVPALDLCDIGGARLYALDFIGAESDRGYVGAIDTEHFFSYLHEDPDLPADEDNEPVPFHDASTYEDKTPQIIPPQSIIYALQITERVSCFVEDDSVGSRYGGQSVALSVTDQGEFVLQVGVSSFVDSSSGTTPQAVSQVSEVTLPRPAATIIPTSWSVIFE